MLFSLQNVCGPATVLQACNPRTDKKSVQNERNRKAGNPALPYGSLCDPQKTFLGFLALEKSTIRSPASGSRDFLLAGDGAKSISSQSAKADIPLHFVSEMPQFTA